MRLTYLTTSVIYLIFLVFSTSIKAQNYNIQERSFLDFPGQTLANVCGYTAPDGREYALLGASKGLVIVDITNPDVPVQIIQIPGPDNLWKEIKVYKHFAYITSEGGQGVQIVDMTNLPSSNLPFKHYLGTGAIENQLNAIHALHIDTTKGFLYTFGGGFSGTTIHALEPDPYNPQYVNQYQDGGYIHDGYADNDTLYACHIYAGKVAAIDMTDKANPILLGDVVTPGVFTHNAWVIPADHSVILTTDEVSNSYLTAYDISDLTDIKELDRLQTTPGSGSIVHNTHIKDNYAVTSWYTDGVNIVDVHRPNNLVQVGRFDTFGGSGNGFDGCWGAFPFFPSGAIITTNIGSNAPNDPTRFYVLTPTYIQACYLEGTITDGCNGAPLSGAAVTIQSNDPLTATTSDLLGVFRTGQPTAGNFTVTVSKPGYITQTHSVVLDHWVVTPLNLILESEGNYTINSPVVNASATPLANTKVIIGKPNESTLIKTTNAAGILSQDCLAPGNYQFGIWGKENINNIAINSNVTTTLTFQDGYYDAADIDYGWSVSGNVTAGTWERGIPEQTTNGGSPSNPGSDASGDTNDKCYVTGATAGGQAGANDVDNGATILETPAMDLSVYNNPTINFWHWFFNGGGQGTPNDYLRVEVSNGITTVQLTQINTPSAQWNFSGDIKLADFITITNNMKVRFIAEDVAPGHLVEAGIDIFRVKEGAVSTEDILSGFDMRLSPNPFSEAIQAQYHLGNDLSNTTKIQVTDVLGRIVETANITAETGSLELGRALSSGVYYINAIQGKAVSTPKMVVKQ